MPDVYGRAIKRRMCALLICHVFSQQIPHKVKPSCNEDMSPSVRLNIRRIRSPAFVRRLWVVEDFLKSRQMTHDGDSLPSLGFCLIKSLTVWRDLERPDGSITPLAPFALQLSIEPCPPQGHRPPLSPAHPNATSHKPRPTIHVVNQSTHYHTNLL